MPRTIQRIVLVTSAILVTSLVLADLDPRYQRHEVMEGVGDAAKPVGRMIRGDESFDVDILNSSLEVFQEAAAEFGSLFPAGTETGAETLAAPAIWEDRDGFDQALAQFRSAVEDAIEENPDNLEDAKRVMGPVFNACKNCHDSYRLEKD